MEAPIGEPKSRASVGVQLSVKSESCSKPTFEDCKDALRKGYNMSGLFIIKPNAYTSAFQVYCDMVSDGGGWTLVASVHEDDVNSKCDSGDMWSRTSTSSAFYNWFNLKSFGNLEDATGEDYKSKALYALNASDMMIWHVPNDLGLPAIADGAFIKYHTTNGFLQKYGSNLPILFTQYFPMDRQSPEEMAGKVIGCVQKTDWGKLWRYSWTRRKQVDQVLPVAEIDKMTLQFGSQKAIHINQTGNYSISGAKPIEAAIRKTSKVTTTLLWIPLPYSVSEVSIKAAWGSFGKSPFRRDSSSQGDYDIQFGAQCGGPYCKVLFTVTNAAKWGSISSDFQQPGFSRANNGTTITVQIPNMNRATLVGYAVFQRKYSISPDNYEWSQVFDNLPACIDKVETDQNRELPSLTVPATFIKGELDLYDSEIIPGFIEFRKYDGLGYPYPICPGVRLKSNADPSLHCIGGIRGGRSYYSSCGDFAAWSLHVAHSVKRATSPSGDDVTDLTSTLLLFYR